MDLFNRKRVAQLEADVDKLRKAVKQLQMWAIAASDKLGIPTPPTPDLAGGPPPPAGP